MGWLTIKPNISSILNSNLIQFWILEKQCVLKCVGRIITINSTKKNIDLQLQRFCCKWRERVRHKCPLAMEHQKYSSRQQWTFGHRESESQRHIIISGGPTTTMDLFGRLYVLHARRYTQLLRIVARAKLT